MEKKEYTVEHFGFDAEQVHLERRVAVRQFAADLLASILKKTPMSEATRELTKEKVDESCDLIMNSFKDHLDALKDLDEKLFKVPEHVLLPQDYVFGQNLQKDDLENLESEVQKSKQLFLENCIKITDMKIELERHEQLEPILADHEKLLGTMDHTYDALHEDMQKLINLRQELHDYENL